MDIACPNCNAAYRVPDALLLQRKPLRCVACGHAWVPELPAEAPPLPVAPILAAAVAQTAAPPEPSAPPPPPPPVEAAPPAAPSPIAAPVVNPPGAPRPASLPAEATESDTAPPRPPRGPSTPPPLAEPKWPRGNGARRTGREEAPAMVEEEEAPRPRRTRRRLSGVLLLLAWLLSLAVVGGTLTILFLFREDVAEAWSPFLRVVDLIGG